MATPPPERPQEPVAEESASAIGRKLASLRRRYVRTCALPGCDVQFEGTARRKYCSHKHATLAAWRRTQAAKRRGEAQEPTSTT
jgi:hypothetical protein